jgi:lipopolysaccharide biosynthesis glycosyltransferase
MRVYIGHDAREQAAYDVAVKSLKAQARLAIEPIKLDAERLAAYGLYHRVLDRRGGRAYDLVSNAYCSTDFALTRFFVPMLEQRGWALFVDCDVVFLDDVEKLFAHADQSKAVMVVKHKQLENDATKMDGQLQQRYARKNWSSVMLFNCDHPANQRLTIQDINERPGRDLHRFYWLHDSEIGELPARWNWLVNVTPKPDKPGIAHFTLGGPWLPTWDSAPHDDLWLEAQRWLPISST